MKKTYLLFVFSIAILLGAVSCTDLLDDALRGRGFIQKSEALESDFPEGARLTLGFNVPMPVATKAMTDLPQIDSIHVFVFSVSDVSENGAFLEVRKATLGGHVNKNAIQDYTNHTITNASENTVIARWNVDLMMGRGKRHIHFVANLPKDFVVPDQGADEFSVLRSIQTSGGDVAYWQMVEVEDGILAYTYRGGETYQYVDENGLITSRNVSSVPGFVRYDSSKHIYTYTRKNSSDETITYEVGIGDYITPEGLKVLDGGGYYASIDLSTAVNLIPLIRNFARIKVLTTASSNFRLKSAVLYNTPEFGFVAPFDDAANKFVKAYRDAGSEEISHATILATGYPATIPENSLVETIPATSAIVPAVTNQTAGRDSAYLYMYERGIPTQKATGMLVYGTLAGQGDRWFKIEISDKSGAFFPIYRDFTYEVNIENINGSIGYEEMEDAWNHDAIGDISGSPETQTLTKIDDGQGLTLWVEYIDHTSTDPTDHSVRLLYKFYKGSNIYTDRVTLPIKAVTGRDPAINSTAEALTGSPYSGSDTPDGSNTGWYLVDVPLYGNSSITKVSTLHVEGKLDAKTMYRDVNYRVMAKQDFALSNDGLSADALNATTTLNITLPDYLGYSVFPLTLMIEAENKNLNPADGETLSVESGSSLFPGGGNSFYFLKTVEYDDYQTNHTVSVAFKTTQTSGNNTWVAVADKEGYFNIGKDYISTGPVFMLSANTASVGANETSTKFTIYSTGTEAPDWTLTADDPNVTFLPGNTGTGSKTITVRFPANAGTSANTYKVTASRTGYQDQPFEITQRAPEFSLSAEGTTIGPDAATVSFDITSTSMAQWTVTADNGATLVKTTRAGDNSVTGTGNAKITVSIPENIAGETYTVTATCPGFATKYFIITQDPLSLSFSVDDVSVKASATTTSFTVSTNSSSDWTITSANVTSATRSGSDVVVTFPANNTLSTITRTVTVTAGSLEKTFTITQKGLKQVTFYTNDDSANFPGGRNPVNTRTIEGVKLTFNNNSISSRQGGYLEINNGGTFTLSSDSYITAITINYTDYYHGHSGRDNNYSSSDPITQSGFVYATDNGNTGTWTGSATSITFTMRRSRVDNSNYNIQIASIDVYIEE